MKTLIIAEKPSVAKDIAAALSPKVPKKDDFFENDNYVITSAIGHLVELYMPQDYDKKWGHWSLTNLPVLPEKFGLKPSERTEKQFNLIKKLMKRKDIESLINACDAGREGELIFSYIYELAECKKPFRRLWMQSMTTDSIRDAFARLRSSTEMAPLQESARSRSEADWLIGINGTRAITSRLYGSRVKELASVGRVQTPTLVMVIERELAIRNFKPVPYWRITAKFEIKNGTYEGVYQKENFRASDQRPEDKSDRIWDEIEAKKLIESVEALREGDWQVAETVKRSEQSSPKLFDLTTLQREMNSRYGFSASTTLRFAQSLYERHKVLTYPRTDATVLPEDYIGTVISTLGKLEGELEPHAKKVLANKWVHPNKRIFNNAGVSDHFAIIPTGVTPKSLSPEEARVYDAVCRRFVAIFFPPAQIDNTTRITRAPATDPQNIGGREITFKTEGKVLVFPGWMEVMGRSSLDSEPLAALTPEDGNSAVLKEATLKAEATKPPARYTEATLLSAMESAGKLVEDEELADAMKERGLGTPATRASIIEHIINTGYIVRERRELIPTPKAEGLFEFLKVLGADALTRPDLTGEWEFRLRQIEEKKLGREEFMKGIVEQTKALVESARSFEEAKEEATPTSIISPTDGKPILEKTRFFESQDGKIKIWKVFSGRRFSVEEISELLSKGVVGPLEGFISRFKRKFNAKIKIDAEHKLAFDFDGQSRPTVSAEELLKGEKIGQCPACGEELKGEVYAHQAGYACSNSVTGSKGEKSKCGFKLSKLLLGQEISVEQVKKLLGEKRETDPMYNFVSRKTGKKFTAILYLKKGGLLGWKFPPRPKKPKTVKGATPAAEENAPSSSLE
jgi:DNA topoisomerase-3